MEWAICALVYVFVAIETSIFRRAFDLDPFFGPAILWPWTAFKWLDLRWSVFLATRSWLR